MSKIKCKERKQMDNDSSIGYIWITILLLLVVSIIALTVTGWGLEVFDTMVERTVFENSYQYQASQDEAIAIYQGEIAELEAQLLNDNLTETERASIEGQITAIEIRLNAAISRQD